MPEETPQAPKTGKKTKRVKPVRADLSALESEKVGFERSLHGPVLTVNGDNFTWVKDSSIDLVLTDPPFNIAQDTNFHTYEKNTINSYRFDKDKGWDTYSQDGFVGLLHAWSGEFARVLRPGGSFAVFCADAYVSHLIDALKAAGLNPRRTLTWRKPNAVPINRQTMMMSACEYVIVGVKGSKATFHSDVRLENLDETIDIEKVLAADKAASIVDKYVRAAVEQVTSTGKARPADVQAAAKEAVEAASAEVAKKVGAMYTEDEDGPFLRGCVPNYALYNSKAGNRLHPTEKPVNLLTYLTKLMSNPGDVILDPFGGSGSTGEAGLLAGREVILVEREKDFYENIKNRVAQLQA